MVKGRDEVGAAITEGGKAKVESDSESGRGVPTVINFVMEMHCSGADCECECEMKGGEVKEGDMNAEEEEEPGIAELVKVDEVERFRADPNCGEKCTPVGQDERVGAVASEREGSGVVSCDMGTVME